MTVFHAVYELERNYYFLGNTHDGVLADPEIKPLMIKVEMIDEARFNLIDKFVGYPFIEGFKTKSYVDIDIVDLDGSGNYYQVLLRGVIGGGASNSVGFDVRKEMDEDEYR